MRTSTINYAQLVNNLEFFMVRQKIHKTFIDGFPVFRPIPSAFRAPTFKTGKFFVQLLKDLTSNQYSIKDTFDFSSIKF